MEISAQFLLILAVAGVGVLHTMVPDHWMPIMIIARQRGWSKKEIIRAALQAGTGHVVTTLLLGAIVWVAGVALATRFGHLMEGISSFALIAFGTWFAFSAWNEMHGKKAHGHSHDFDHLNVGDGIHGPELVTVETLEGEVSISIFESGIPPRFRISGENMKNEDTVNAETIRSDGSKQLFHFSRNGKYFQSDEEIPEPHEFSVVINIENKITSNSYNAEFTEHAHAHEHHGNTSQRTALLLILGSSPMIEGIPAFFAASKYGFTLIVIMSIVFALSTISTYVFLCVYSTAGLQRLKSKAFEKYGEVISGVFIAIIGLAFWIWPVF